MQVEPEFDEELISSPHPVTAVESIIVDEQQQSVKRNEDVDDILMALSALRAMLQEQLDRLQ